MGLDGVSRFSNFAAAMHKFRSDRVRFALVQGASHHSFASGPTVHPLDLVPEIDTKLAHSVVAALKLEGSAALGTDICNSDFPTNPTCNYPKYPAFSLPPGPKPAPPPLPAKDCICGSKWVTDNAFPDFSRSTEKGFQVHAADAFHDVSDTHPFHLPHIWNNCSSPASCNLNVTTLTMLYLEAGPLFPNASAPPLSAYELRTKLKSRQTLWEAAALGKQSPDIDKKNLTLCRHVNELAWSWA